MTCFIINQNNRTNISIIEQFIVAMGNVCRNDIIRAGFYDFIKVKVKAFSI
jgi:hypothetical protein